MNKKVTVTMRRKDAERLVHLLNFDIEYPEFERWGHRLFDALTEQEGVRERPREWVR